MENSYLVSAMFPPNLPILTRYLYITFDVYYSLLKSLLISPKTRQFNEDPDATLGTTAEVLFWTFELYCSGLKEETINLLQEISEYYPPENDKIMTNLFQKYRELTDLEEAQPNPKMNFSERSVGEYQFDIERERNLEENKYTLIANIAENLIHKIYFYRKSKQNKIPISLHFVPRNSSKNDFIGTKCKKKRCCVRLTYNFPIPYSGKTVKFVGNNFNKNKNKITIKFLVETPKIKHYNVLKNYCLYDSYKWDGNDSQSNIKGFGEDAAEAKDEFIETKCIEIHDFKESKCKENIEIVSKIRECVINSMFNGKWLYYCYNTPIWRERIDKYKGQINRENKTIEFPYFDESLELKKNVEKTDFEDEFNSLYDYEPDSNMYIINRISSNNV